MRLWTFALLSLPAANAVTRIPIRQTKRSTSAAHLTVVTNAVVVDDGDVDVDLQNVMDLVYMAEVNIGGIDYPVQLDSGSSDLWVKPKTGSLQGITTTQLTYNISYAVGSAFGNIVTAPVSFAGYTVQSQALLDVTDSNNPVFGFGAVGILGLGFTSLSGVDKTVTASGSNWGHSFFYNAFAQNTSAPNYVAVLLERTTDKSQDNEGSFSIGELEEKYANDISATGHIPTWPVSSPRRWNVLLDGYEFGDGIKRTLTTNVQGAPSTVLLLDTGASYTYAPESLVTGLYGSIPGASFKSSLGLWVVPCNQQVNLAFWIAGRKFDWHPLDLVVPYINDNSTCVGSVVPSASGSQYDLHAGDVFLRNVYTILDFGDFDSSGAMGDPYVQLLSLTDVLAANKEYQDIRGATPTDYRSSVGTSNADGSTTSSTSTATTQDQLSLNVDKLVGYAPIALGILGLNAVMLMVLIVMAIILLRGRNTKKGRNAAAASTAPLSRTHSYQRVDAENPDLETPAPFKKFSDQQGMRESSYSTALTVVPLAGEDGELTAVSRGGFKLDSNYRDSRASGLSPSVPGQPRGSFHPIITNSPQRIGSSGLGPINQSPASSPRVQPAPLNSSSSSLPPASPRGFAFDAPDSPGGRMGGHARLDSNGPMVGSHIRTDSSASSISSARTPGGSPMPGTSSPLAGGTSKLKPLQLGTIPVTFGGIGHIRSASGASAGGHIRNGSGFTSVRSTSNVSAGPPTPRSASNLRWKAAEEADLTDQRLPLDSGALIDLQAPPSLGTESGSRSSLAR